MKVIVGSKNPVKINSVKLAFEKVWPGEKWEVVGEDVASGVSDQPMSDVESLTGARNRARACQKLNPDADYCVGLEGGLQQVGEDWFDCGWIAVLSKDGREGSGCSVRIPTPPKMMREIKKGMELGHVCDKLFNLENSKHSEGHAGLMTNNILTRTSVYVDAVIMALSRYLHDDLFEI